MQENYFKYENYPERDFPVYSSVRINEKKVFSPHFHKDAEILQVIKGTVCVQSGTEEYVLGENDIIFFSPYSIHSGVSKTDEVETHSITFDTDILKNYADYSYTTKTHCVFNSNENKELREIFNKIFNAYWEKGKAYKLKITAGLLELSALLTECGFILSGDDFMKKLTTYPALEYIKENYNKEIKISDLSSLLNFCPEHFARIFKKENKKTPGVYITDYRIGEALKLLAQNKYSVSEIANMTGFSSSSHFVKVFRERLNTTPGKYRNQKN